MRKKSVKGREGKKAGKGKRKVVIEAPALKQGETFSRTQLPKVSREMYSRLSQIYGIPVKELTPRQEFKGHIIPTYQPITHNISMPYKLSLGHEIIHSLQWLLCKMPRMKDKKESEKAFAQKSKKVNFVEELKNAIRLSKNKRYVKYGEPGADVVNPQIIQPIHGFFSELSPPLMLFFGSIINPKIAIPLAVALSVPGTARRMLTRHYYKKHGADGLILLFAEPPRKMDLLNLREKEKEFVEKGFLKAKAGFTRKGIQHMRRILPRGLIMERLQEYEKYRKKEKEMKLF